MRREYDNCQLVRWVLREKGVRLLGPPPATLVDPVSAEDLRREMTEILACNRVRLSDPSLMIQDRVRPSLRRTRLRQGPGNARDRRGSFQALGARLRSGAAGDALG